MLKIIWIAFSSLASVMVARSLETAVASSQSVAYKTVDNLSQRLMRKLAWTLIGISLFASGIVLSILEVAAMGLSELTLALTMKIILTLMGIGFLYAGLSAPKVLLPRNANYSGPGHRPLPSP